MDISLITGTVSTVVFAVSYLPMLRKALRTRDVSSYRLSSITMINAANTVYSLYVFSLPAAPSGRCTRSTSSPAGSCSCSAWVSVASRHSITELRSRLVSLFCTPWIDRIAPSTRSKLPRLSVWISATRSQLPFVVCSE